VSALRARLAAWLEASRARAVDGDHRERGWDLARAFAIVMMVLINFQLMLARPPAASGLDHGEQILRWLVHVPSGRSSTLFVVLSGVGFSLLTRAARETGDRVALRVARRALLLRVAFLFVLGNLLHVVWSIDILHFYACYLLLATLLFLRAPDAVLLAVGALVTIAAAAIDLALPGRAELPYLSPLGMLLDVLVDGVHPVLPWLAFVSWGAWLGRRDLSDPVRRRAYLRRAALVVVTTELASLGVARLVLGVPALAPVVPSLGIFGTGWDPAPLFVVSACGTATCFVCLAHEIVQRPRLGRSVIVRALVSTGQLALSIYLLHAIVGVVLPRFFLGWGHALSVLAVTAYWLAFVLTVIVLAFFYRALFLRGPLEAVMRALTSWRLASERGETSTRRASDAAVRAATEPDASAPRGRLAWAAVLVGVVLLVAARTLGLGTLLGAAGAELHSFDTSARLEGELSLARPRQRFAFEASQDREVTIETRSGLDLYLELDRLEGTARTRVSEDDDSGEGVDARLTAEITPGRYELVVRPYAATTGPFVVEITTP
jgi:uncharacterized protein